MCSFILFKCKYFVFSKDKERPQQFDCHIILALFLGSEAWGNIFLIINQSYHSVQFTWPVAFVVLCAEWSSSILCFRLKVWIIRRIVRVEEMQKCVDHFSLSVLMRMRIARERKGLKKYKWNLGWSKGFDFLRDDRSTAKTVLTCRVQLYAIIINLGKGKAPLLRCINRLQPF